MSNNPKTKDGRNKRRSMKLLEAAGYQCTQSASSLGSWGIVGIGSSDVVLVQVKTRDWPSAEEMEMLKTFRCPPNCRKLVHRWADSRRLPDVREI